MQELSLGESMKKPTYKRRYAQGYVPKTSYRYGYDDEGISDNLGKPRYFKYSEQFLKWWYTEMSKEK